MSRHRSSQATGTVPVRTATTRHAFLVYANRSGSTLLSAQLSEHIDTEQLLVIPEFRLVEFLFHVGDEKARRLSSAAMRSMIEDDRQIAANLGLTHDELLVGLETTAGEGIRMKLETILEAYAANNVPAVKPEVVLWKWGNAATYVDEIGESFPEARFVHVIRDGRAVVNSLLTSESPYFPGEDLARGSTLDGVHHWKSSLQRNTGPARAGLDSLVVRYSDLVEAPQEVSRSVKGFLGLGEELGRHGDDQTFKVSPKEEGIHRLVTESPQSDRIDGWQTELAPWRRFVVEHAARGELREWGYDLFLIDVSTFKGMTWLIRAHLERILGLCKWAIRRLRHYRPRLTVRLLRLRIRAWAATRQTRI